MLHVKSGGTVTLHTEVLHDGDPASLLDSTDGMSLDVLVWRWSGTALEFLDWADNTFKALGAIGTLRQTLSPVSDAQVPGVFYRAWTVPTGDYTCGYVIRDIAAVAKNVPQQGAISVGQWADQIGDIETDTQNIQSRLPTSLVSSRMRSHVEAMDANVVNASAIATGAIDADAIAASAIDGAALADSAVNKIVGGVWSEPLPGTFGAGEAGRIVGANINSTISSRSSHSAADVWAVAIRTLTAIGTSGISSQASVDSLRDAVIVDDLTAAVGCSTTEIRTGATQADGFYNDLVIIVWNAAGVVARRITGYLLANGTFTVPALPFIPSAGDRIIVLGRLASSAIDLDAIADAVWDEDISGHLGGDKTGQHLSNASSGTGVDWSSAERQQIRDALGVDGTKAAAAGGQLQSKAEPGDAMDLDTDALDADALADSGKEEIADQVWDETIGDHLGAGSTGAALNVAGSGASAADIADAVWDEAWVDHESAGSFGRVANTFAAESTVTAAPAPTALTFGTWLSEIDDTYKGMSVVIVAAAGWTAARTITAYTQTGGLISIDTDNPLPEAPLTGDTVIVLRRVSGTTVEQEVEAKGTICS